MTIAMLIDNPRGSRELYESLLETMEADLPLGGICHVAGPSPAGGWRVIEVWDTEEEARTFLAERFAPALRSAGFEGPPPTPQLWPVVAAEVGRAPHDPVGGGRR